MWRSRAAAAGGRGATTTPGRGVRMGRASSFSGTGASSSSSSSRLVWTTGRPRAEARGNALSSSSSFCGVVARGGLRNNNSQAQNFRSFSTTYPPHEVVGLPSLSPTMEAGTIAAWKVAEGKAFAAGDVIAEIETDKATVDFEAQDDGVAAKFLVDTGREVKVGEPILVTCETEEDAGKFAGFALLEAGTEQKAPGTTAETSQAAPPTTETVSVSSRAHDPFLLTPSARFLSHSRRIDVSALAGSGKGGRITKGDVLLALKDGVRFPPLQPEQRAEQPSPPQKETQTELALERRDASHKTSTQEETSSATSLQTPSSTTTPRVPFAAAPLISFDVSNVQTTNAPFVDTPATTMRKVIAKRLTESRQTVPHAYASVKTDLGKAAAFRKALVSDHGIKVSVNDLVVKAVALALRDVPRANSSWLNDTPTPNDNIDVSVAVATPTGLITPIVFNTPSKGLTQISAEIRDLAKRARDGKLKPHEFQGGTCSVSNLGMFGVTEFSAVINPPQACILAVGSGVDGFRLPDATKSEPVKATTMTSRLSYDRRVVDEPTAALFLQAFGYYMANPATLAL